MLNDSAMAVNIKGRNAATLAIGVTAVKTSPLACGRYDVWSDIDAFVRVASFSRNGVLTASPNRAEDVTASGATAGYQLYAKNMITLKLDEGDVIGVIAAATGNFFYQKTD